MGVYNVHFFDPGSSHFNEQVPLGRRYIVSLRVLGYTGDSYDCVLFSLILSFQKRVVYIIHGLLSFLTSFRSLSHWCFGKILFGIPMSMETELRGSGPCRGSPVRFGRFRGDFRHCQFLCSFFFVFVLIHL